MKQLVKHKVLLLIILAASLLRLVNLGSFPPGLYSDETAYGYNAYSLLTTGKDEYGTPWPLTLKSFGDYKPPMTAWLIVPSIMIFGLNEFAVRFPSALAGVLTVVVVYFLSQEIFPHAKLKAISLPRSLSLRGYQLKASEIAALFLALSPWHLHFSRASMLVGIEALFVSLGFLLFIKGVKQPKYFYGSSFSFAAAIYTYYGSRVTVPLLILSLVAIFYRQLKRHLTSALLSGALGIALLTPLFLAIIRDPTTLTGRARTISIFYDPGIKAQLWQAHTLDGVDTNPIVSRIFHNKVYFYGRDILRRYLQHFSYDFLVVKGDPTPPFHIPNQGVVYGLTALFFLVGLVKVVKHPTITQKALIAYVLISPVSASLTFITPAANRSFNLVIPVILIAAYGLIASVTWCQRNLFLRFKKIPAVIIAAVYVMSFTAYLYNYYVGIPQQIPHKWHYGRKELIEKISTLEDKYDRVVFSHHEGPAYIWLLFYKQYNPQKYWQTVSIDETLNELGWLHVEGFDKYIFPREFNWETIPKEEKTLYVGYENEIPDTWVQEANGDTLTMNIVDQIVYPNGNTAFKLVEIKKI